MEEVKKYYYATECDPESFDYRMYLDEETLEDNHIWVGGNRDYSELNEDLKKTITSALDNCESDIEVALEEYESDDPELDDEIRSTIDYYFKKDNKTDEDYLALKKLCIDYGDSTSRFSDYDIICKVLKILYNTEFTYKCLKGYCQGDWVYCIYPKDSEKFTDYLEAVCFVTGKEFSITCDKVSIDELESDEVDVYCDYTELYKTEDIKKWLAGQLNCSEDEIKIRFIKDTHYIKRIDYEEV